MSGTTLESMFRLDGAVAIVTGGSSGIGLATAVEALARHAPGKLAYINLYPDYATINNPDRTVYLILDEAHRGFNARAVSEKPTLIRQLINGDANLHDFVRQRLKIEPIDDSSATWRLYRVSGQ